MGETQPDIIVAIDLGTTYTGVAWARPQRNQVLQTPIQIVHNWPGSSTKNEQKVHTCLVYNQDNTLSSWGYLCEDEDDVLLASSEKQRREFFKIFLDKQTLEDAHQEGITQAPTSVSEAQKLVSDYLRQIYTHVKSTIELHTGIVNHNNAGTGASWADLVVEFIFSVPTTWRSQEIINVFKNAIRNAGFGTEGPHHTANVDLTESEAAAVGTIKSSTVAFEPGDIFLSVDAGGGTTDFALMQVVEAREPFPSLAQINQVDGIGIGSTLIDHAFLSLVNSRLGQYPELLQQLPPDCAQRLAKSERFKTMKHKFGERVYESPTYKLPLEGVPFNFSYPAAGIEFGRLILTWEDIQSLFDPHVSSITEKIQEQLVWMQAAGITRPISYMILSGGLGSSKYVRDCIQHELMKFPHPYAHQIQILQAPDPQLVVVKGLLLDRLQKLDSGYTSVIVSRIARSSYGFMCKAKYNPAIHTNETIQRDPYDGELYAMGQIDWMIKKGDPVNTNAAISSTFTKKIEQGDSDRSWESVILTSDLDRDFLPTSTSQPGARQLCVVKSNLAGVHHSEMTVKRKEKKVFFMKGKKFYHCTFDVKAIIAPADIRFELWFGGQRFSKNHEPIQINWGENPDESTTTGTGISTGTGTDTGIDHANGNYLGGRLVR